MKKHILLIDDDRDNLKIFVHAMQQVPGKPFKCTCARDRHQAREMLKYLEPDFVFVDFNIPELKGVKLVADLKTEMNLPDIPVYLYTANISPETSRMARLLGAAGCIGKTDAGDSLVRKLQSILEPAHAISMPF